MNRRRFVSLAIGTTASGIAGPTLAGLLLRRRRSFSFQKSPSPEHGSGGSTTESFPLEKYDCLRYGPLLGVSDEGSAAKIIADAAYLSAKAKASSAPSATIVGMIVDGERMTSAGEAPIGPEEFAEILPIASGRTFCTTNVGTRVNARLHQPFPEFLVKDAQGQEEKWLTSIFTQFDKFVHTPNSKPRPLTVRLVVHSNASTDALRTLVPKLEAGRKEGKIGPADLQRLSILVVYSGEIKDDLQPISDAIHLAAELSVPEVAVDGEPVEPARRHLSIQGLLNVLEPAAAEKLLGEAARAKVRLSYRYENDPESAARTIWAGLFSARALGLNAAKYGLTPLVLDQQRYVIEHVQRWMKGWTAIPAFYIDIPLVTSDTVYQSDRCVEAAQLWLKMASSAGAKVVLIDAPDRIKPRRLLKAIGKNDDIGVLNLEQAKQLNEYAEKLGLRVLWAGGIHADQAFQLAKLGVFGIFTTTSTAKPAPVEGVLASDPAMAASSEPTLPGVRKIHALVQAGFLCHVLSRNSELSQAIENSAEELFPAAITDAELEPKLSALNELMQRGWQEHWKQPA